MPILAICLQNQRIMFTIKPMTVESIQGGIPTGGSAPTLSSLLFRFDGAVSKDDQFSIRVTNFDANSMKGTIGDSKGTTKLEYDKSEGSYGSVKLAGKKHIFSHNNYKILRGAIEERLKGLQKKA